MQVGVLSMAGLGFQPVGVPFLGAGAAYDRLLEHKILHLGLGIALFLLKTMSRCIRVYYLDSLRLSG